jgi:ribonuclease HI
MNYTIYSDGAATMKKVDGEYVRVAGGWSMIVYDSGNCRIYGEYGGERETTNNAMELYGIYRALKWLKEHEDFTNFSEATIMSDSAYCVNIFNDWIKKWEANGWTRGKKHEPIENLTAIKAIYNLLQEMPMVKIQKVKGHSTVAGNNLADKYAVQGKQEVVNRGDFVDTI